MGQWAYGDDVGEVAEATDYGLRLWAVAGGVRGEGITQRRTCPSIVLPYGKNLPKN